MQPLAEVIHKKKKFDQKEKNINKSQLDQLELDDLLTELIARGLIVEPYRRWFGSRLQLIGVSRGRDLAAIALADARQPARLFAYLVRNDRANMHDLPSSYQAGIQAKDLLPVST